MVMACTRLSRNGTGESTQGTDLPGPHSSSPQVWDHHSEFAVGLDWSTLVEGLLARWAGRHSGCSTGGAGSWSRRRRACSDPEPSGASAGSACSNSR